MHIETVCTGDELLTGLTSDTNSAFFQRQLLERLGEQVRRSTVVGDERNDIEEALRVTSARADVVLVSGGLGPTADDLTVECAARVAGVGVQEHAGARAALEVRMAKRGIALTPNNLKQVAVPVGAEVVLNAVGSAPMFVLRLGQATVMFVPGVPREYRHLVEHEVVPRIARLLEARGAAREYRVLKLLKTVGLPESHLDAKVAGLLPKHPNVIFGFRTHLPENHLKLLAHAPTEVEAAGALARAEADAREVLGQFVFAQDDETMAGVVGRALTQRQHTLAVAESCTGGLVSQMCTAEGGASAWFVGGAITYAESMKQKWADVSAQTLKTHTAVSEQTAREMASGVAHQAGATWGLSITGYAGPTGGTAEAPVGTVFVGLWGPNADRVERHLFAPADKVKSFDRERIRSFAAHAALDLLRRTLFG